MIKIYALVSGETNMPFYVGASIQTMANVLGRHAIAFRGERRRLIKEKIGFGYMILDQADSVEEASVLEEYWFWQLRS